MEGKKMKKIILVFLVSILMIGFACSEKASTESDEVLTIEDLLVESNEITGWEFSGTSWTANSITELTTYINGAADIYQRHGFEEGTYQSYSGTLDNGSRTLELIIYDMGSEDNAKDTYDDTDIGLSGATTWTDGAGSKAHYVRYGGLSQVLTFYSSSYFVYLGMNYDTDESLDILKQFALNVDGKIQ